jgi:L-cystine uptake protein TcyP (sodium:dicarboxylate symporter family)|tara:strand:+ start:141 stop:317 length:177 start_codon:yes stop_codon:yes gene_type:complete
MKKKLAIGAVILALIAGVAFWAIRGEDIKEKAVEEAVETVVETVVEDVISEAVEKLIP